MRFSVYDLFYFILFDIKHNIPCLSGIAISFMLRIFTRIFMLRERHKPCLAWTFNESKCSF